MISSTFRKNQKQKLILNMSIINKSTWTNYNTNNRHLQDAPVYYEHGTSFSLSFFAFDKQEINVFEEVLVV